MHSHNRGQLWRAVCALTARSRPGRRHTGTSAPRSVLLRFALVAIVAGLAAIPTAGLALDPDKDFPSPGVCRPGQDRDSHGNPCIRPNRPLSVLQAKTDAANAYHRFLTGEGSKEEVERADYVVSKVSREDIGKSDWSLPQNTPAARKLRGEQVPRDYGPLQNRFWPFEQINWWYCGPATAQSILWYLGPHRSETVDPEWGLVDPAAGAWFPEMALELVHNANP